MTNQTDPAIVAATHIFGRGMDEDIMDGAAIIRSAYAKYESAKMKEVERIAAEVTEEVRKELAAEKERDAAAQELRRVLASVAEAYHEGHYDADDFSECSFRTCVKSRAAIARWDALSAPTAPNPEPVEGPASPGAAMRD